MNKGIRNSIFFFILFLSSSFINYAELIPWQISTFEMIIVYLLLFVIQIFLTNNDVIIHEEKIIIQSSLFKNLRKRKFKIEAISEIIFKEDWTESSNKKSRFKTVLRFILNYFILMWFIPWEYKWIQIKTKDNKKFTYYCFGINYDFYENHKETLFEDLFLELAKRNIVVKWKSTNDIYFKGIQDKANKILLELNK